MAHIFHDLDYTVSLFIVRDGKVLLVHHRKLGRWLPVGGHIELGEDPEEAARREAKEESGYDIELFGARPPRDFPGTKILTAPSFLDVHDISEHHRHVGLIYFARVAGGELRLAEAEHHAIRWFSPADLADPEFEVPEAIQFYSAEALKTLS